MEPYTLPHWANCENCEEINDKKDRIDAYVLFKNEGYCKICGNTVFIIGPTEAQKVGSRVRQLHEVNMYYKEVKA